MCGGRVSHNPSRKIETKSLGVGVEDLTFCPQVLEMDEITCGGAFILGLRPLKIRGPLNSTLGIEKGNLSLVLGGVATRGELTCGRVDGTCSPALDALAAAVEQGLSAGVGNGFPNVVKSDILEHHAGAAGSGL